MRPSTTIRAAVLALLLLLLGSPASAQYLDPDGPVVVDDATLRPGQSFRVSGAGFDPSSDVEIWVYSDPVKLATVTTDGGGAFSVLVTVPADLALGSHTVQAVGKDPVGVDRVLSSTVTVSATGAPSSAAGGGSALPRTGVAIGSLVLVGAALLLGGSITTRRTRRA